MTDITPQILLPAGTHCPRCGYKIGVPTASNCPECGLERATILTVLERRSKCAAGAHRDTAINAAAALVCTPCVVLPALLIHSRFAFGAAIFYGLLWLVTDGLGVAAAQTALQSERVCWKSLWLRSQPLILALWILVTFNRLLAEHHASPGTALVIVELLIVLIACGVALRIRVSGRRRYMPTSQRTATFFLLLHIACLLLFGFLFFESLGYPIPF